MTFVSVEILARAIERKLKRGDMKRKFLKSLFEKGKMLIQAERFDLKPIEMN